MGIFDKKDIGIKEIKNENDFIYGGSTQSIKVTNPNGAKKKINKKKEVVQVYVTEDMKKQIEIEAEKLGMTVSSFALFAINKMILK